MLTSERKHELDILAIEAWTLLFRSMTQWGLKNPEEGAYVSSRFTGYSLELRRRLEKVSEKGE